MKTNSIPHKCKKCGNRCSNLPYCAKHNPLESVSDKKIENKSCPKCNHSQSVYLTSYSIKRTFTAQRRFKCLKCKCMFTERNEDFDKKIPKWKADQIRRLTKTSKGFINKFDNLKKATYSTREISKKLSISKSFVAKTIKNLNE